MAKINGILIVTLVLIGFLAFVYPVHPAAPALTPANWNEARRKQPDGSTVSEFHVKFINFADQTGAWKPIDLSFTQTATGFLLQNAPYSLQLPARSSGLMRFVSTNRYSIKEKRMRDDAPFGKTRTFTGIGDVLGQVTAEGILYPNALPGADLLVQPHEQEVRWLIVWRTAPSCNGTLTIPFTDTFDPGAAILNGSGALPTSDVTITRFEAKVNDFRGIGTKKNSSIWDSAEKRAKVELVGKRNGMQFIGRKIIPCNFFQGATYPVYTDDSSTFYPDPNVEVTSVDGRVAYADVGTWATVHDAADGTDAFDSTTNIITLSSKLAADFAIHRGFTLFDTSSLPDAATITAATVQLYELDHTATDDDGNCYITVVNSTPASNTALTTADYDQCGDAITNPTKYSDDISISAINSGVYNTWTLNATGRGAVSKTGITKLGEREGHDQVNDPITATKNCRFNFASADTAGTSQDPLLTVTYSTASSFPKAVLIF